jgi:hypothetical protein
MNLRRLLESELGKNIISILLGLGLASLFRKVCTDKNCLQFNGPIISDIEDKTFKHGEKCYQYKAQSDRCDTTKKIIPFISPSDAEKLTP